MKGLKRKALVLGCAALPMLCQAGIKPISDSAMGKVTGQSGITVELETKIHMDQFKYTDQGSFAINNITIGGAGSSPDFADIPIGCMAGCNTSDTLDNISLHIDEANNGDLIINMLPIVFQAVDFKVTTGEWDLQGTAGTTDIMNNFKMVGLLGSGTIRVLNNQKKLSIRVGFAVSELDADLPIFAIGIRNLRITGENFDPAVPQPLDLFSDNTFYIYKATSTMPGSNHEGMDINIPSFGANIQIGQLLVGGTSIGSISLNHFELHNTNLVVYGH